MFADYDGSHNRESSNGSSVGPWTSWFDERISMVCRKPEAAWL